MRKVDGTATISIEKLDELREHEQWLNELRKDVGGLVKEIDTERYDREIKKIDDMRDISEEEIDKLVKEATGTLKIIVSEKIIRKLVREYIDEEKNDAHYAVHEMTNKELEQIPLFLDGGQQDKGICEICETYMTDVECDFNHSCPAAGIIERLKEAESENARKDKIVEKANEEIKRLKKKVDKLSLEKSYMVNPCAIGDRHEMGG